jgi:hypothetical protein
MNHFTTPGQTAEPTGRALVVYESMFGNTAALARAVRQGLEDYGFDVDVVDVGEAPPVDELAIDLLVLGAPTHAFSLSHRTTREDAVRQGASPDQVEVGLREWLAGAQEDATRSSMALAFFDSRARAARRLPGSAAHKASRLARDAGFPRQLGTESFYVDAVNGPLLPGELDRASAWGRQVAAHLSMRSRVG